MVSKNLKIFLAGHKGHLGSAIYKKLKKDGFRNIVTINKSKLNLLNQDKVFKFLKKNKPKIVIIAAARVGGIHANNTQRAKFIYENLTIQKNQLQIEKEELEEKFKSLLEDHNSLSKKLDEFHEQDKKEEKKQSEFSEKIDELNQETDNLLDEIDKWQT